MNVNDVIWYLVIGLASLSILASQNAEMSGRDE